MINFATCRGVALKQHSTQLITVYIMFLQVVGNCCRKVNKFSNKVLVEKKNVILIPITSKVLEICFCWHVFQLRASMSYGHNSTENHSEQNAFRTIVFVCLQRSSVRSPVAATDFSVTVPSFYASYSWACFFIVFLSKILRGTCIILIIICNNQE